MKAINVRFQTPEQHATIIAAAKAEGVSAQEYILRAAMRQATALEGRFLDAFRAAQEHAAGAFAKACPEDRQPDTAHRAAEQQAARDLEHGDGNAA